MADQASQGLLSPWLRSRRINAVKPYLHGRVLDYGCGSGELASLVSADSYIGYDIDSFSIKQAQRRFPGHSFTTIMPAELRAFDVVVSLAVIEHVEDAAIFLGCLSRFLREDSRSKIVVTTPHPSTDWIHSLGARIGLFSGHASEEHEELLNLHSLRNSAAKTSLSIESYKRFMFGANQVAVIKPEKT